MSGHVIAHAVVQYIDSNGGHRVAYRGDEIDAPAAEAERLAALGAFETRDDAPPVAADEAPADPRADLVPPRPASNKAAWAEYATALGIAVDGLDKDDIIAAVAAADEGNDDDA